MSRKVSENQRKRRQEKELAELQQRKRELELELELLDCYTDECWCHRREWQELRDLKIILRLGPH